MTFAEAVIAFGMLAVSLPAAACVLVAALRKALG
jgi:hypothetical protein